MRRGTWLLVLSAALLAVGPADAALKKYNLVNVTLTNQSGTDEQNYNHFFNPFPTVGAVALVDATTPGSPKLVKLLDNGNITITVPVPSLTTSIFLSNNDRTGPGVTEHLYGQPGPIFTGTGNVNAGATIRWGTVTGWSITGQIWCHSLPAIICTLADRMDKVTTDPPLESEFYDLGTWFFHGTGFTSVPWIDQYFTTSFGNNQWHLHAGVVRDGTVPAMELLGIGILGLSLATGGAVAIRRKNKP